MRAKRAPGRGPKPKKGSGLLSVRKRTYDALKGMILSGQLRPGQRLSEMTVAEQLGVSRTPLREALMKLEEEGLVIGRRNVGYNVVDLDLEKVCNLLIVREALDVCAAGLACRMATEADLEKVQDIIGQLEDLATARKSPGDTARELELGIKIHKVIVEATRNESLVRVSEQIYQQLQLALWLEVLWVDLADSAIEEHRAIADAIRKRDVAKAKSAASRHVRTSLRNMSKVREVYEHRRKLPYASKIDSLGKA